MWMRLFSCLLSSCCCRDFCSSSVTSGVASRITDKLTSTVAAPQTRSFASSISCRSSSTDWSKFWMNCFPATNASSTTVTIFERRSRKLPSAKYCVSRTSQLIEWLITPSVKTDEAVDQDRQGTSTSGFGQFVAANDAIWPPIESPVMPSGPNPFRSHQFNRTSDSSTRQPPITNMSDTFCRLDALCSFGFRKP
uniref:Putative secreted protein n=1 Tax=Anopheles darlingi TaxID=43151 RepID=A0A2M4D5K2_ANODA